MLTLVDKIQMLVGGAQPAKMILFARGEKNENK